MGQVQLAKATCASAGGGGGSSSSIGSMVCPMRFVLVALSAAVAAFAFFYTDWPSQHTKPVDLQAEKQVHNLF